MTLTPTAAQLATLRRMIDEPTDATYTDAILTTFLDQWPMVDERGEEPYYWVWTAGVPTRYANPYWVPSFDLNGSAADIWDEKATKLVAKFDVTADGATMALSQKYQQAIQQAKHFRARRGIRTIKMSKHPKEQNNPPADWIGNLPENPTE